MILVFAAIAQLQPSKFRLTSLQVLSCDMSHGSPTPSPVYLQITVLQRRERVKALFNDYPIWALQMWIMDPPI